jgi:hypothetical protein
LAELASLPLPIGAKNYQIRRLDQPGCDHKLRRVGGQPHAMHWQRARRKYLKRTDNVIGQAK